MGKEIVNSWDFLVWIIVPEYTLKELPVLLGGG